MKLSIIPTNFLASLNKIEIIIQIYCNYIYNRIRILNNKNFKVTDSEFPDSSNVVVADSGKELEIVPEGSIGEVSVVVMVVGEVVVIVEVVVVVVVEVVTIKEDVIVEVVVVISVVVVVVDIVGGAAVIIVLAIVVVLNTASELY